ncbi:MAG: hypothetical protein U9R19_10290 [Bacteroidota bacterium]|nr:hypothetical protein [Bacteroidota bacterium]
MNFDKAKTALLMIDSSDLASKKNISSFVGFLEQNKIQVKYLIYLEQKEIPEDSNGANVYISKKSRNFWGLPKQKEFSALFENEFDLLIDLSIKQYFAFRCIASLSRAKFKIGMLPGNSAPFDFMIDLKNTRTLSEYINQIKKYLPMLG